MSDDDPAFINAWMEVMPVPKNVLLCCWHVDKNWRKNIKTKVKGLVKQSQVYKACRTLMECLDSKSSKSLWTAF